MASISSTTGIVSGINYAQIIDSLMQIEEEPVTVLQIRIDSINSQKAAYSDLSTKLTTLKGNGTTLKKSTTWGAAVASSSNTNVATATAQSGAKPGSYQLTVAQLAAAQQSVSTGFTSESSLAGAGTLSFELGGGSLSQSTDLSDLNGGAGVSQGQFKITDAAGNSAVIDTSSCVTLDDVISKINTNLTASVSASVDGDHLVITDDSGGAGTMKIKDLASGSTAKDLGLTGTVTGTTLSGTDVNNIGSATTLSSLNDGRGVSHTANGDDFAINTSDGSAVDVSLANCATIGDVLTAINTAGAGKVVASVGTGGNGITLTDQTGSGAISVTALNGSSAASELGLAKTGSGGTLAGSAVVSGLNSVLISSLNGGRGFAMGTVSIRSKAGTTTSVDLSGASTVADVIKTINSANAGVQAAINVAGNGISLDDTSGGSGSLAVSDTSGTTAASFGWAGTFASGDDEGSNLHLQWVSGSSALKDLNGGNGVSSGTFTVISASGRSTEITLGSTDTTLQNVIDKINSAHIGVNAGVNTTGDGLLLTDSSGGGGTMSVKDITGTAATDLKISGTATANQIDGAYRTNITVAATDTLDDVVSSINSANTGMTASIIDDGSGTGATRISLQAKHSGLAGQVAVSSGTTKLNFGTIVSAQDAAVFYGGGSKGQSLVVKSSSNVLTNAIANVSVDLVSTSDQPITVTVNPDVDSLVQDMNDLVTNYNAVADQITTYTAWNSDANTGGVLLGDSTTLDVQSKLESMINAVNKSGGTYKTLTSVGFSIDDSGDLAFDEDKFRAAYAKDPEDVQKLFSQISSKTDATTGKKTINTPGLGYQIENAITDLTDPVSGVITEENHTLDTRIGQFQDRITDLNQLLDSKRTRLETQFANLETVLANLQSQQSALGSLTGSSSSSSSKSG